MGPWRQGHSWLLLGSFQLAWWLTFAMHASAKIGTGGSEGHYTQMWGTQARKEKFRASWCLYQDKQRDRASEWRGWPRQRLCCLTGSAWLWVWPSDVRLEVRLEALSLAWSLLS